MGNIKQNLALKILPKRRITNNALWVDLCENIHLHIRNLRIDMSEKEWANFVCSIRALHLSADNAAAKYRFEEGDPNFLINITSNNPLEPNSDYYPNRATLELEKDDTVHFHYRDLRLHFDHDEFNEICDMFVQARKKLDAGNEFPYKDVKEPTRVTLPIDMIQPYDAGHRYMAEDREHREGIEKVKELIRAGKKILPILVNTDGQRFDGFKRYMAFKELGYDAIDCIVDPNPIKGGQANMSWIDEE